MTTPIAHPVPSALSGIDCPGIDCGGCLACASAAELRLAEKLFTLLMSQSPITNQEFADAEAWLELEQARGWEVASDRG